MGFILIGGIGLLSNPDIGVSIQEVLVVKGNVPYNAEAVGNDAEFISITEMPVDVDLPDGRDGGGI